MRRALDALYDAAAYVAAFFLIMTLVWVLVGIGGRFFNFYVRGTDAYAGYAMAGCAFLALAHTLKRGEHIRVELVLQKAGPRLRRALQLWSYGAATLLAALFAFYSVRLAWQSYTFNDVSTANDATPLWIPQIGMAIGTIVLFVAFADELVLEWRGERRPPGGGEEATHHE
ncbi:MAG TPA: TRAP transporter small permease [Alphaproteobacteria bacterium]|jgi:TRAP-type C4-dicarboxylate transport system permease small subunit